MTDAPKTPHPQEEANFVSKIILWWIFPLLQKGTGNYLNQEDLHPIRDIENSRQRTDLLDEKWREEILSAKCLGRKPKLWRALFRCYGFQEYWHLVPLGLTSVFGDNITFFATITLLGQLISFYSTGSRGEYYVYIYGITIGCLMRSICLNHLILDLNVLGVRARAAVVGLLYKKVRVTYLP